MKNRASTKPCNCTFCKRDNKWNRFLKKYSFSKNDKKFLNEIYTALNMTEFEYEVDEAILDGSWPLAVEILGRAMEKAENIKKRREAGEKI